MALTGSLVFLQTANSTADTDVYTFSSQNLGLVDPYRYIIVGIHARKAGTSACTIDSVTIGGVTATIIAQQANQVSNTNISGLAVARVPSGSTGDIVVTFNAAMLRCGIGAYGATNLTWTTAYDSGTSTATAPTYDLDIPSDGFAIGVASSSTSGATTSWTGLTEGYDFATETYLISSGAGDTFTTGETNRTITATFSATTEPCGVFASFNFLTGPRYWVGDGGNWSDTSHWAITSGGTSGASAPGGILANDVYFDANSFSTSGQTVTIDETILRVDDFDTQAVTNNPQFELSTAGRNLYIYGDMLLGAHTWGGTNYAKFNFVGPDTQLLYTNGVVLPGYQIRSSGTGGLRLTSDLDTRGGVIGANDYDGRLYTSSGSSTDMNGYSVYTNVLTAYGTLDMTGSTVTLTGYAYYYPAVAFDGSVTPTGSTINIEGQDGAYLWILPGSSITLGDVVVTQAGGSFFVYNSAAFTAGLFSITNPGGNLIVDTTNTITVSSLVLAGSAVSDMATSYSGTGQFTISQASGTGTADYVQLSDSNVTGGATFTATNSTDVDNNTGWTFGGGVTVSPSAISYTMTLNAPSITGEASVAPSAIPMVFNLNDPVITAIRMVEVTPSPISMVFNINEPTISVISNIEVTPAAIPMTFTLLSGTVAAGARVKPSPLQYSLSVQSASIRGDANVAPGALSMEFALGSGVALTPGYGNDSMTASLSSVTDMLTSALSDGIDVRTDTLGAVSDIMTGSLDSAADTVVDGTTTFGQAGKTFGGVGYTFGGMYIPQATDILDS